jgi:hypothetical protein
MKRLRTLVLLGGLAPTVFLGCGGDHPNHCEQSPTSSDCPAPDSPPSCAVDEDCPGQVCDIPSRTCVQCTTSSAAACTEATPVCDADDHTCRACAAHSECPSNACLPDGTCAAEDQVAYVAASGTGTACRKTAPCARLADAVETLLPVVKIDATGAANDDAPVSIDNRTIVIVSDPGATLDRDGDGTILALRSSDVRIEDLHITGQSGSSYDGAISLQTLNGEAPRLQLERVAIDHNSGSGIQISGGDAAVTITDSHITFNLGSGIAAFDSHVSATIYSTELSYNYRFGIEYAGFYSVANLDVSSCSINDNKMLGVSTQAGMIRLTRSKIYNNHNGGVQIQGSATESSFSITNNFVFNNGDDVNSIFGGMRLSANPTTSELSHNTIVLNQAAMTQTGAGGVVCDMPGFTAPNNIIARNYVGTYPTQPNSQISGQCTYPTSTVISTDSGLGFRSTDSPYDFHLRENSVAVDTATTPSSVDVDFDGDARPQGAQKDQGADEYTP